MIIVESQICPPLYVLVLATKCGGLIIEAHENYQKKSFRNRMWVATPNGKDSFSVPLESGKASKSPIQNVKISYQENWTRKLKNMMVTNYGATAYFDHYIDSFLDIFETKHIHLWNLNNEVLNWSISSAQLDLEISYTSEYKSKHSSEILDLRNKPLSFYRSTTSKEQPEYDQIFMGQVGFIANLSVIDLIMNTGPESGLLISQWAKQLEL